VTARETALAAAEAATDKLGENVVLLNLEGHSSLADYFVIVTAGTTVHARAIAEEVAARLKEAGGRSHHIEGTESANWILLDYVDVVVHILLADVRQFYGLERLWGDMPQEEIRGPGVPG
jgi:ribosome-associated protein